MSHEDARIREMAAAAGIPEDVFRREFVPQRAPLPAPSCPPWCSGTHGWEWAGALSWSAMHAHELGTVQGVTVVVAAEEAVTVGDLPTVEMPAVWLCGDLDKPFSLAQAEALAAMVAAAGRLLASIGGAR